MPILGIRKSTIRLDRPDCTKGSTTERQSNDDDNDDINGIITSATQLRSQASGGTCSGNGTGASSGAQRISGQGPFAGRTKASGNELAILGFTNYNDYWEHPAFGRSRITAIVIALVAICFLFFCLVGTSWVYSGTRK